MKTLVVLSALATLAIAAPAQQEDRLQETRHVPEYHIQAHSRLPELVRREKKSTIEQPASASLNTGATTIEVHNEAAVTPTGRNTGIKKPLIVKKKFGYTLYRDSEEEKAHADSNETCGRQVKVKLCDEDGKLKEMLRSSGHAITDVHSTEDDMKLSIKMAKEAVENLQRDLLKIEHRNAAMKMAHDTEADSDLHQDIEVARQALDHIHTNFDNLETMKIHATASRDSEAIHDVHITLAKSEEEKMAQWKEAVQNIQKNIEIARNIEDSFKVANNQENLLDVVQPESESMIQEHKLEQDLASHVALSDVNQMRDSENAHLNVQPIEKGTKNEDEHKIEHLDFHHARESEHTDDDMNPSASEVIEMKTVDIQNKHTLKSENHQHHEHEKSVEAKLEESAPVVHLKPLENIEMTKEHHQLARNSEAELDAVAQTDSTKIPLSINIKAAENSLVTPKLNKEEHNLFKATDNVADAESALSTNSVQVLSSHKTNEISRSIELEDNSSHQLQHQKNLDESVKGFEMKTVEHTDEHKIVHQEVKSGTVTGKTAEILKLEDKHFSTLEAQPKEASLVPLQKNSAEHKENLMKSADDITLLDNHKHIDYNDTEESTKKSKSAEDNLHHVLVETKQADSQMQHHLTTMKEADNTLHILKSVQGNNQWSNENKNVNNMKAAEEIHSLHAVNHKIDYNETEEPTKKSKSAEDHLHLNQFVPMKQGNEHHLHHHITAMKEADNHLHRFETVPVNNQWTNEHRNLNTMKAVEEIHNLHGINHKIDYNESDEIAKKSKSVEDHLQHQFVPMKQANDHHLHHHLTTMKATENHLHRFDSVPNNKHWSLEHRNMLNMKTAEEIPREFHEADHMRNTHMPDHHFNPSKMGVTQDFDMSEHVHQHAHVPSRFQHNLMSHSQMHDLHGMSNAMPSNFHPSMRDAMDGFGSEHNFRWMPSHESARNAYGAGLSGSIGSSGLSGGAVGVFPNANTGGCGIPLLLSCSPSVVSGSLAKAHATGAGYSSPSYRTEDEFGFHNKRDIKKTNDIRSTNVLRTPSIVKQKTGTVVEDKL